jgi:chaperonin GroEL
VRRIDTSRPGAADHEGPPLADCVDKSSPGLSGTTWPLDPILEQEDSSTGTTLFSDGFGDKLEDVQTTQLGSAKTVTITNDHIVLLSAAGDKHAIEERCGPIRVIIDHSTSEYEMDKLKERLAKLTGGIAVIKVGGASEVEVNEVKGRLNDALCATKAALEEGLVPGGGTALL